MSTLQKAMNLLQTIPEQKIEAVYTYMLFVNTLSENKDNTPKKKPLNP